MEDIKKEVAEEVTEVKEVTEEIEVTDEVIEKVAKSIEESVSEKLFASMNDKIEVKDLGQAPAQEVEKSAAVKTFEYVKGLMNGTVKAVSGAMDETDTAELLPPAEFTAEVQRLELEYGVALRDANIRRTTRTSVLVNKKATDVVVYETGEGAQKTVSSMDFEQVEITLKKYAAIVPLTDELLEDSAVDLFAELTNSFARAYAKVADELVFTNATSGLLHYSGVNEVVLTAADGLHDVTFDDLNDMVFAIPSNALQGAKFYMHPTVLSAISKIKEATTGAYIWNPGPNGIVGGTIWGYPYELVEVMPAATAGIIPENTEFLLFGNLKYTTLLERTGIQLMTMKEGTVGSINLGEQDVTALRAVKRFNAKPVFANAFSRLKTNSTIS